MIQDSGNRREFETEAVRDIAEGKGRCDLLPLDVIAKDLLEDDILKAIHSFMYTGDTYHIRVAINTFINMKYDDVFTAILEVSKHYEEGCKKYGDRNWEMGIPLHCYIDSGVRHYLKWLRKDDDEPHDRAFIWNMLGLLWTLVHHPELNDLPYMHKDET